jgi:hypothetical protein
MSGSQAIIAVNTLDFVDSIGVNTHLGYIGSSYSDLNMVESALEYLAVTNVRDLAPVSYMLSTYETLAALGIKFDLIASNIDAAVNVSSDLAQIAALVEADPGGVAAIEGPNELNVPSNDVSYNGLSATNPAVADEIMQAIYQGVVSTPSLAGIEIYNASVSEGTAGWSTFESGLGNESAYVNDANAHVYYGSGEQPQTQLLYELPHAQEAVPGGPIVITETGYLTQGTGSVDQITEAREMLNALMDAYKDGVSQTYLYQLLDDSTDTAGSAAGDAYALFNADGTPKLAATAIHDLIAILADTGANAQTFTPGSLDYSLTGLPSDGNSLLMEKSNGAFDISIWAEPDIWNPTTNTDISVAATNVTVSLGATYKTVEVFDPLAGTAPIATYTNVSSVVIGLTDHPLIVEIEPSPITTGTTGQTVTLGSTDTVVYSYGPDTVVLGTGSASVNAYGPTILIEGAAGALNYTGTAKATITGGAGAMKLTLSASGSSVTGGSGGMTIVDDAGGNTIIGAAGNGNNGITVTTTIGNDLIETGVGTAINTIDLGAGNDRVVANGTSDVTGTTGNDSITVNGTIGDITTSIGTSSVTFNTGGELTSDGTDTVVSTGGALTIAANGPSIKVTGGRGFLSFIGAGTGNAAITGGSGGGSFNSTNSSGNVTLTTAVGAADTIVLGAGTATISSHGNDTITMGSGAATITALGPTINIQGGGGALTYGGTAQATISGGIGAMVVTLDGSGSTVTGGSGGLTVVDKVGGNTVIGVAGGANNGITVTSTNGNDYIETGWSTATNTITLGAGDDTVIANGTSNIIGTAGNDTITVNEWYGSVDTGTGTSTVTFNTEGDITTRGTDTVTSNAGTLVVNADGPSTTVYGGSGYLWFGGIGTSTIYGGSGGGNFDFRSATGDTLTTTTGTTNTVWLGAGAATINSYGNDTIHAGSGNITLIAYVGATLELAGTTTAARVTDRGTLKLDGISLTATSVTVSSGKLLIGTGTIAAPVANSGTIEVTGGTLDVTGAESGAGALEASASSVLRLAGNSPITSDSVTISLTGAGSEIEFGTGTPMKIENSLTTIASGGTFAVVGNRGYTTSLGITDSGLLQLARGTFASASLSTTSGGKLLGFGTVTPAVANAGTIEANGGVLDLSAGASGAGALIADVGATLELAGTSTATTAGSVTANGTVDLVGGTLTASSITVASGGELLAYGTVTSAVANSGSVAVNGGQLYLKGGVTGTGALVDTRGDMSLYGANSAGAVTVNVLVDLLGATLTATSVTIASSGDLIGNGIVTPPVINNGEIVAAGAGTLDIVGTISGIGSLSTGGSTLELSGTTAAGTVTDSGKLDLNGITLTASSVRVASTGHLIGVGTVTAGVVNSGTIEASGGTLDVTGAESGTGALAANASSVLQLAANSPIISDSITISLTGAGSEIEFGTGTPTKIESSLTTIASGGTLAILGNRSYSTSNAITDSGVLQITGTTTLTATSVTVASGGLFLGSGTVASGIANSSTVEVDGGQLYLKGGVTGTGALLDALGNMFLFGTNSGRAVTVGGIVSLTAAKLTATSVTIAIRGDLTGNGTVTAPVTNNGEIVAAGGTLDVVGAISGVGTLWTRAATLELSGTTAAGTVTDSGTLDVNGITLTASSVTVASAGHLIGAGTVAAAVTNSGTIESTTSLLDVTGAVTGTGTLKIDAGTTLEVGRTVASSQTAVFASTTGTLSLDQPLNFAGSITDFTGSDQIYLGGQTITGFGGYNTATHVLTVLGTGNATIAQLTFNGSYTLGNFSVSNNGLYVLDPPVTAATTGGSSTLAFISAAAGNQVIAMPAAGLGLDDIGGFSLTNGDVLDFTAALKGTAWHGDLTQVGNLIAAVANGSETDLYLAPTGPGHGSTVAVLEGVHTTVASLLAHDAIRIG